MASMSFVVIALFLAEVSVSLAQSNPYCSISTCPPNTNTLCKYSNTTWGTTCVSASAPTISQTEKATIVSLHNDIRRKVAQGLETRGSPGPQPASSNMRQLVWDNELAVMAQTHAQQCVFQHDACRNVGRFQVGQNIYMAMSSAPITTSNWAGATKSWFDEVQYMNTSFVTKFPGVGSPSKIIGHYTAMVWATTYTVGCGAASYKITGQFPYVRLHVCNYGPTGNWIGLSMYTKGTAGSACPVGTKNSNGLCA